MCKENPKSSLIVFTGGNMEKTLKKDRALFLIDETRDFTNDFYIIELTKIVLFEEGAYTLTLPKICERIEQMTEMQYTKNEVLHAIQIMGSDSIECVNDEYGLTSIGQKEMSKRKKNISIVPFVKQFIIQSNDKYSISDEEAKNLIYRFIFERFNENIAQISSVLDVNVSIQLESEKYSEEEKSFINDFLAWNDSEKNRLVYRLVAKSFDYCMINSKCGKSTLDFSKFYFYIDTNIILRLMGFNNEERQSSVKAFIEKCKNNSIHIVVSNFVLDECRYSIERQIDVLEHKTSHLNSLVSPQGMSFAEENSIFCGIYNEYYSWCKNHKHKNYIGFRKHMSNKLNQVISQFESSLSNKSFELTEKTVFDQSYRSLEEIKFDKHIIKTDINSILLVEQLRKKDGNSNYHLISADGNLILWAKECFNAEKGLIEYPSTWFSVLLKYTGREKTDDFKSFCQFIHLPINPENENDLRKKLELKEKILFSDIDDEIKSNMLEDVKNNYYDYKNYKTNTIIHNSYTKTKEEIVDLTLKKFGETVRAEQALKYEKKKKDFEFQLKDQENKHTQILEETKKERFDEGFKNGQEEIIDRLANKAARRNRVLRVCIAVLSVLLFIVSVVLFISVLVKTENSFVIFEWLNKFSSSIRIIMSIFSGIWIIIVAIFKWAIKGIDILPVDVEKLKDKYKKKYK